MKTSYNAQLTSEGYFIQYETDNRENFKEVEKLIQRQIDNECRNPYRKQLETREGSRGTCVKEK